MNREKRFTHRTFMIAAVLVVGVQLGASAQEIRTASEQADFERYTSYEEMWEYLQKVQASSTEMVLSLFGATIEGREQPYAVFSRPLVTQPWEALVSGKPIVVLAANVHGGEKTVRESLLILARELATSGTEMNRLLDKMVILIAPSVNPDGFVRNTRGNATGADMNRDYTKLEQPASCNYTQNILQTWHPHIYMDGHNGGAYPYNICYQGPVTALADQSLTDLCDQEIFPFIDSEMEAEGYRSWYYSGGNQQAWTGIPWAHTRSVINYGGVINSIAILFESPGQDRRDGALSGLVASKAIVKYVAQNPDKLLNVVNGARHRTIELGQKARGEIAVAEELGPKDYKVSYLISQGRGEDRQIIEVTGADLMIQPVVVKSKPRPYAYILEPRANQAIEFIKQHKVTIEVLQEDTELAVEAYKVTAIDHKEDNQHPAAVVVTLADETVKLTQTFPKGSYVIRTGQVMGRIIAGMCEPETQDNVVFWNTMDALLPRVPSSTAQATRTRTTATAGTTGARAAGGRRQITEGRQQQRTQRTGRAGMGSRGRTQRDPIIPIFKLMIPTPLPTKILKY